MSEAELDPVYDLHTALDPDGAGLLADVTAADRAYFERARIVVERDVLPVIDDYWDRADYPVHIVRTMGELDLLRDGIDVPGRPPMSGIAAGLVAMEFARGDGSMSAAASVQGGLALRSVALLGSDAQRERWLVPLADGTELAGFALTEPRHGSDSAGLEATAESVPGGYRITGVKKWIGNGSVGSMTVTWARGDDGDVHGFLVPQDAEGYRAEVITGKIGLRAIWQTQITYDRVFVPEEARLPGARTFADTAAVLIATRLNVAWSALGHATACYETAVAYTTQREQFGRPLAKAQGVQLRLATMLTTLTQMQLMAFRMAELADAGRLTGPQASIAKLSATRGARAIAAEARDLLGGNGMLVKNRVGRHFADIEAVHTYEGTDTIQSLLIGRDATGLSAFR